MSEESPESPPIEASELSRRVGVALDLVRGLLVVTLIVALALLVLRTDSVGVRVAVGVWVAACALAALPGFAILHAAPPRRPMRERSALAARSSSFLRTVAGAAVFALSIVAGTVSGVVAGTIADEARDPVQAVAAVLEAMLQSVFGVTLVLVAAIAFVVMVVRWLLDLTAITAAGGARELVARTEERWSRMPRGDAPVRAALVRLVALGTRAGIVALAATFLVLAVLALD